MSNAFKGIRNAAGLGGTAGFVAGLAASPGGTVVKQAVKNVYGGAPEVVPTLINHATTLPIEYGVKAALIAGGTTAAMHAVSKISSAVKNRNLGRQFHGK